MTPLRKMIDIRCAVRRVILAFCLALAALPAAAAIYRGAVIDADTGAPIAGAVVTLGAVTAATDAAGTFLIEGEGNWVAFRALGFGRAAVRTAAIGEAGVRVPLKPIEPRALYLSFWGIGSRALREPALALADAGHVNALVVDVKGDRAMLPYPSAIPLAAGIGARKVTTVKDLPGLVAALHARGVYAIARIVVFKDDLLARARPEWAVRRAGGGQWRDREGLGWVDPFRREVWDYNIAVAQEAAAAGFDEIQFDYIRFPDARGLAFSQENVEEARVAAISGFLDEARRRLVPYNVFLSADIFGYVCWNTNDTEIGQRLEDLAGRVDYLAPMLYPSGFHLGIPGYRNPVAKPAPIIERTLERARERTGLPPSRFRPWLQAFRDYAFDRREFGREEIQAQIRAADAFGANGWMLWNPRNVYRGEDLRPEEPALQAASAGQP
ncbi:MAG: putative glycoside hydrolase [Gammaproteobacteria bacterium]